MGSGGQLGRVCVGVGVLGRGRSRGRGSCLYRRWWRRVGDSLRRRGAGVTVHYAASACMLARQRAFNLSVRQKSLSNISTIDSGPAFGWADWILGAPPYVSGLGEASTSEQFHRLM